MHSAERKSKSRLAFVLILVASYMVVEVAAGIFTKSLALIADAGHMLTDAASLGLALLAIRFAERRPTTQKTYGYFRSEILAAFLNALLLIGISIYILYEAWGRILQPRAVLGGPMLVVSIVGLFINLTAIFLLHKDSDESLNVRGAYLEVISDLLGSVGVIAGAVIILTTGWYLADPIISVGIGLFILPRTWKLLSEVAHILMEGVPQHVELEALELALKNVTGVREVHDLHVWTITSGLHAMSAHITVTDLLQTDRILRELRQVLKDQFQIDHTTIQLEDELCAEDKDRIC